MTTAILSVLIIKTTDIKLLVIPGPRNSISFSQPFSLGTKDDWQFFWLLQIHCGMIWKAYKEGPLYVLELARHIYIQDFLELHANVP